MPPCDICGICVVVSCSSSLLLFVPQEGCASWLWNFLDMFTQLKFLRIVNGDTPVQTAIVGVDQNPGCIWLHFYCCLYNTAQTAYSEGVRRSGRTSTHSHPPAPPPLYSKFHFHRKFLIHLINLEYSIYSKYSHPCSLPHTSLKSFTTCECM